MFKQLAYVVSFSLICSLLVALTLVPMLSARILPPAHKPEAEAASGLVAWLLKISERFFIVIERVYRWMLDKSLSHAGTVMGIVFLLLLTSLVFLPSIGVEFMPSADEGEVRVQFELEPGTQLRLTENKLLLIEKIVRDEVKEAANIEVTAGSGGGGGGGGGRARGNHSGRVRISLVPKDQRTRSSEEVATALRRKLSDIAGIKLNVRVGQGLFLLRMGSGDDSERIQIEIKGHNLATTELIAGQVQGIAERVQGVTDAVLSRDARSTLPEEVFVIDRQKAGDLKLTVSQIANMLQTVLSGTVAGYYRESGREHRILVKFRGAEQMDLNEILSLTINNSEGKPVILGNVVQTAQRRGPSSISRKNQQRIVTVSVNVSGRDVGAVISELREKLNELPRLNDVSISFGSDYEEQRRAFWELIMSLILALTLVYMVMASQYESLWDPFLVMFSVPLAIIGVIAILLLTGTTFNLQSFIGCIMLGGIAVNNAILLVDQSNQLYRHEGQPLREAVMLACTKRLRPILMTSLTTILGLLPMSIGAGEGGEAQAPLARVVIGGMLTSTFITLLFIPALYYTFYQWREKRLQK
jgi:HAE1 family hydrophobic/amphiphilic exporter-1